MMLMNSTSRKPNIAAASRLLGAHQRNFYAARSRMKQHDSQLPLHLCERQRQHRSSITEEVKDLVIAYWTNNTCVSPNKKDVCQKRVGRKLYEKHPVHLLEQPQVCLPCYAILYNCLQLPLNCTLLGSAGLNLGNTFIVCSTTLP